MRDYIKYFEINDIYCHVYGGATVVSTSAFRFSLYESGQIPAEGNFTGGDLLNDSDYPADRQCAVITLLRGYRGWPAFIDDPTLIGRHVVMSDVEFHIKPDQFVPGVGINDNVNTKIGVRVFARVQPLPKGQRLNALLDSDLDGVGIDCINLYLGGDLLETK